MGFCLEYPSIGLHAISRDASAFPQEHLYVMVNGRLSEENEGPMGDRRAEEEEDGSSGDEEEEGVITEVRFVPGDKTCLEPLFAAMCECQALHPDPEDQDSENEFEGEEYDVEEAEHGPPLVPSFYTCEEGLSSLTPEGRATLQRLEGLLQEPRLSMGGVRTEEARGGEGDGMEVDPEALEDGQFEDADVDH
ncbi:methylosome subunit pICln isoform 2-T3 [Menidia menidia]